MKITRITVGNRKQLEVRDRQLEDIPSVELTAELDPGDDPQVVVKNLRLDVEAALAQHADLIRENHEVLERIKQADYANRARQNTGYAPIYVDTSRAIDLAAGMQNAKIPGTPVSDAYRRQMKAMEAKDMSADDCKEAASFYQKMVDIITGAKKDDKKP